jgi:hypothetical protein
LNALVSFGPKPSFPLAAAAQVTLQASELRGR